jgi:hypothetical protein
MIKLSENLIYRANIFNYESRYFDEYHQINNKIDFSLYNLSTNKNLSENYLKFENFVNLPLEDQLGNLFSLTGLLNENDSNEVPEEENSNQEPKKLINKDAKIFIQVIVDLLESSTRLIETTEEELNSGNVTEINSKDNKKSFATKASYNLINSLLFLDGIIMSNIDLAGVLELLADNVGVSLVESLFSILDSPSNYFSDYTKEVAAHIISCIQVFSVKQEYGTNDFQRLVEWVMNYNYARDRKRTCFLTSILYIVMSHDKGLQCFLEVITRGLSELVNIMVREYSINIVYESIFCVWNISNSDKYIHIFEENQENIIDKLIQVIKLNKVEKVIRIGTLCIKVKL